MPRHHVAAFSFGQKLFSRPLRGLSGLQQVLLNLVMNGMEAMSGVEQRSLELTVRIDRGENEDVVVAVTDRGTGIKPHELDRVFKAFHTTKSASLGMGLAICRSIIEAHGGRLWAESNIGPGTTFKFTLPAGA
jgi:signal transduction histidine kinase